MKKLLFLLATSLAFVACSDGSSDNKNTTTPPSQTPENEDVTFVATVGEYSRMNGKEWEANDALSVVETSGEESAMKKYSYTATSESSEGLFTSTSPFTLTEGESATFTIYYPYNEEGDEITESTSKQSAEGHKTYDYLYCSGVTATYEAPEAIAVLEHKMSELTLDFQYAEGLSKEDVEYITIKNILVEGSFDPETGVAEATGTPEDLVIYMDEFTGNIILYPQTIDNGIELELTMVDGSVISATLALTVGELVTGYSYTWDVEVEASDIESEDDPQGDDEWNDDDEDEGDDEPEPEPEPDEPYAITFAKVTNIGREYFDEYTFTYDDDNESTLDDYEADISEKYTFSNVIYSGESILEVLEDGGLKTAIEGLTADYAVIDSEDGVFLFNIDADDNLTAVAWLDASGSELFAKVEIDHSTVRRDADDEFAYISMTIDAYNEAHLSDGWSWETFTRNYYSSEDDEEGWTETITSDIGTITTSDNTHIALWNSDDITNQILSLIGISELTHQELHNAGWWTTILNKDGSLVEQGWYNSYASKNTLGWFVDLDGYLDTETPEGKSSTSASYYQRIYGGNEHYSGSTDIATTICTFNKEINISRKAANVSSGTTGHLKFVWTNGVDKIVLEVDRKY